MSLFKNTNEEAFVGGRKHWTDVIKNTGDGNLLIWRQPEEDFNTNSTLIVMPGEQAIFIKGGTVEQIFDNGTYKLSTENYPFISRMRNAFSGGVSTFNCVVYFVKSSESKEILWGTATPISVRDKAWGVRTSVGTRGSYKIKIDNPSLFLEKLVGSNVNVQEQTDLNDYFANEFQEIIKSYVSKFLNGYPNELIGLDEHLSEISNALAPHINETLKGYGIRLVSFSVAGMDVDETKYDAIDISQMEAIAERRRRQSIAAGQKDAIDMLGDKWEKVTGAEILSQIANNPGAGGIAAAGAGMGLGVGAAGTVGSIAAAVFAPAAGNVTQPQTPNFTSGRFETEDSRNDSGYSIEDIKSKLSDLKELFESGVISQTDYDTKRAEIISRM